MENKDKSKKAKNSSFQYILIDKYDRKFTINPEELNLVSIVKDCFKSINYNYENTAGKSEEDLNIDDAVYVFNALHEDNEDLKNSIISLFNQNPDYIMSLLNPDDYKCIKLVTRETTNIFYLPFFEKAENSKKKRDNRGSLVVPIIYSSDLRDCNFDAYSFTSKDIHVQSFIEPGFFSLMWKIFSPEEFEKDASSDKSMIPLVKEQYPLIKKCFLRRLDFIEAAEKAKGKDINVQIIRDFYESTKNKHINQYISRENATPFDIMSCTSRVNKGVIETRDLFKYYVPDGDFFYRMIIVLLAFYKKVFLINNKQVSLYEALKDPVMYERYLMYSEDEIAKILEDERLKEEEKRFSAEMKEIYEDVKDDLIQAKLEEDEKKKEEALGFGQTERELQDEINEFNANNTAKRPSYIPAPDEYDELPFERPEFEVKSDTTPEDYYSYEDYMYNKEIRNAIDPSKDDETDFSDYHERKDGNR